MTKFCFSVHMKNLWPYTALNLDWALFLYYSKKPMLNFGKVGHVTKKRVVKKVVNNTQSSRFFFFFVKLGSESKMQVHKN